MAQDASSQINNVMNRLRAQLYNTIEQKGFDEKQYKAYKQTVKNITSDAWNDVTSIVETLESKIKE